MRFEKSVSAFLNLLFPSDIYCAACGNLIDGTRPYALCDECVRGIEWHMGVTCAVCGKALAPHRTGGICRECRERGRAFDAGISCCAYSGGARVVVRAMKYRDSVWIAAKLADVMYDRWCQIARTAGPLPPSVVTNVPMSAAKRRMRGYDQAEAIARRLSRLIGAPFAEGLLIRSRETAVMSALGAQERRENMAGAFEVGAFAHRLLAEGGAALSDVTLVDDVFTTGNTADVCAAALKDAGVERVTLFTFAAGADTDPPSRESGEQNESGFPESGERNQAALS